MQAPTLSRCGEHVHSDTELDERFDFTDAEYVRGSSWQLKGLPHRRVYTHLRNHQLTIS